MQSSVQCTTPWVRSSSSLSWQHNTRPSYFAVSISFPLCSSPLTERTQTAKNTFCILISGIIVTCELHLPKIVHAYDENISCRPRLDAAALAFPRLRVVNYYLCPHASVLHAGALNGISAVFAKQVGKLKLKRRQLFVHGDPSSILVERGKEGS